MTVASAIKTYGQLSYDPEHCQWLITNMAPHVAIRLKNLFPKIRKSERDRFRIEDTTIAAADLRWFMSRYPLESSPADSRLLQSRESNFYATQAEAERILLPETEPSERKGLKPGQSFRDYQLTALDVVFVVRQLVLLDDLGLGKTYEGLGVGLLDNALPLVVVMQPGLQQQWYEKATEFIDLKCHKVKGTTPYSLPSADIYLVKYSQLAGWVDVLGAGWIRALVFDEIQELRTGIEGSSKGAAANEVCRAVEAVGGYIVGLSSTPQYNYGIETFNVVNIIRPGFLGTREEFMREWCVEANPKGIVKDPDALGEYLQESMVYLRRTKKDVGQDDSQLAPHLEWIDPNEELVTESVKLAEALAIKTVTAPFHESGMAAQDFDLKLRQLTGIAKARQFAVYIRMFAEADIPVLVFGWHREVYRIWEEELRDLNPLFYTGSESPAKKERNKKAFINRESNILIMSLRSGAGVDGLQEVCSCALFGELDWSPKIHRQCVGRLDRDGQEDEVFVFIGVTDFGSDPEIIAMHGLKTAQSDGIVDPGKSQVIYQSSASRVKKMAEKFLETRGVQVPNEPLQESEPDLQFALI